MDFRFSSLPSIHGEKIVLRLLDKGRCDINLAAGSLAVVQTVVLVGGQPTIGQPKTKRSARRVHLTGGAVEALGEHIGTRT